MIKWIRQNKYLELSGESRSTFLKLRNEGFLAEGIHYKIDPLNRIWINIEAMDQWVEGKVNSRRVSR